MNDSICPSKPPVFYRKGMELQDNGDFVRAKFPAEVCAVSNVCTSGDTNSTHCSTCNAIQENIRQKSNNSSEDSIRTRYHDNFMIEQTTCLKHRKNLETEQQKNEAIMAQIQKNDKIISEWFQKFSVKSALSETVNDVRASTEQSLFSADAKDQLSRQHDTSITLFSFPLFHISTANVLRIMILLIVICLCVLCWISSLLLRHVLK